MLPPPALSPPPLPLPTGASVPDPSPALPPPLVAFAPACPPALAPATEESLAEEHAGATTSAAANHVNALGLAFTACQPHTREAGWHSAVLHGLRPAKPGLRPFRFLICRTLRKVRTVTATRDLRGNSRGWRAPAMHHCGRVERGRAIQRPFTARRRTRAAYRAHADFIPSPTARWRRYQAPERLRPFGTTGSSRTLKGVAPEPFVGIVHPDPSSDPSQGSVRESLLRIALERRSPVEILVLVHAKLHLPADRRAFDVARRDLSHKGLVALAARTLVNTVPRKSGTFATQG